MIASRRKADKLREVMRMRGLDEACLARLAAPAGPDAGAKAPGEIALVAIVGVLAILRGRAQAVDIPVGQPEEPQPKATAARFVNPVCGTAVDTAAPKHVEEFEGTAYYFCCDCCWTAFRENPAKYAAIQRASAARVPA
jgi:xanthine dehydrogenase accessory factor